MTSNLTSWFKAGAHDVASLLATLHLGSRLRSELMNDPKFGFDFVVHESVPGEVLAWGRTHSSSWAIEAALKYNLIGPGDNRDSWKLTERGYLVLDEISDEMLSQTKEKLVTASRHLLQETVQALGEISRADQVTDWVLIEGLGMLILHEDEEISHQAFANVFLTVKWWSVMGLPFVCAFARTIWRQVPFRRDREQIRIVSLMKEASSFKMGLSIDYSLLIFHSSVYDKFPSRLDGLRLLWEEVRDDLHLFGGETVNHQPSPADAYAMALCFTSAHFFVQNGLILQAAADERGVGVLTTSKFVHEGREMPLPFQVRDARYLGNGRTVMLTDSSLGNHQICITDPDACVELYDRPFKPGSTVGTTLGGENDRAVPDEVPADAIFGSIRRLGRIADSLRLPNHFGTPRRRARFGQPANVQQHVQHHHQGPPAPQALANPVAGGGHTGFGVTGDVHPAHNLPIEWPGGTLPVLQDAPAQGDPAQGGPAQGGLPQGGLPQIGLPQVGLPQGAFAPGLSDIQAMSPAALTGVGVVRREARNHLKESLAHLPPLSEYNRGWLKVASSWKARYIFREHNRAVVWSQTFRTGVVVDLSALEELNSTITRRLATVLLPYALRDGKEKEVMDLVQAGAVIDSAQHPHVLLGAVMSASVTVVNAILEAGADVSITDADGNTAMHLAARAGRVEVADTVWSRTQCDLDALNNAGKRPLSLAMEGQHESMMVFLIANGAFSETPG